MHLQPAVFVPLLLVGIALMQALVWIPILLVTRRRRAAATAALHTELQQAGEHVVRGPTQALKRQGRTSRTGVLVLTKRRLLFLGGGRTEIPVGEIQSVRADKWFNGNYRNGVPWMILTTERTGEVGFMTGDGRDGWTDVVRGAMAKG